MKFSGEVYTLRNSRAKRFGTGAVTESLTDEQLADRILGIVGPALVDNCAGDNVARGETGTGMADIACANSRSGRQ
jgi:hypothetical protein